MESIKTLMLLKNTFQKCCNDFLKLLSRSVIIVFITYFLEAKIWIIWIYQERHKTRLLKCLRLRVHSLHLVYKPNLFFLLHKCQQKRGTPKHDGRIIRLTWWWREKRGELMGLNLLLTKKQTIGICYKIKLSTMSVSMIEWYSMML